MAISRYQNIVFDSYPAPIGKVDSRLNRRHHTFLKDAPFPIHLILTDIVDIQAKPVTGFMWRVGFS